MSTSESNKIDNKQTNYISKYIYFLFISFLNLYILSYFLQVPENQVILEAVFSASVSMYILNKLNNSE